LDEKDYTAGTNNFLHSLFSQCNISLNGVSITPSADNYNHRAYLETILTCGSDAAESHLTNAYWYKDDGNMLTCDPTDTYTDTTNKGFIRRWNLQKEQDNRIGRMFKCGHMQCFNIYTSWRYRECKIDKRPP
jgi:hypothetical protein